MQTFNEKQMTVETKSMFEITPLSFKQIAKEIGDSVAEVEFRFGNGKNGTFLDLGNDVVRPSANVKRIIRHEYLDKKLAGMTGDGYFLKFPVELLCQIGVLEVYTGNEVLSKKIRGFVLTDPDANPSGENGEYFDTKSTFNPINHESIAKLAEVTRLDQIFYFNLSADDLRNMKYDPRNISSVSWVNKNGQHEYCYPCKN